MIKEIIKHILLLPLIPLMIMLAIKVWIETGGMTSQVPEEYVKQIQKYRYLSFGLGGMFWIIVILNLIQ
jgi:ACR3 family arsenite efflux pump ArsB